MSEGESIIEAKERLTGEELIEEIKAKACKKQLLWKNAEAKSERDQETKKNIAENAQNFWRFFNKIPTEDYPRLGTPEKLIEALNKAGGDFVNKGDKFSLNNAFYQVFEVHPPTVASDEILDLCDEKRYSPMWGTNFWDNPPKEGSLFIPVVYLVKKLA